MMHMLRLRGVLLPSLLLFLFCGVLTHFGVECVEAQDRRVGLAVVNPVFRSEHRATLDLNGTWDFRIDQDKIGDDQNWFAPDAEWSNVIPLAVPGCWEAEGVGGQGLGGGTTPESAVRTIVGTYKGTGWYRTAYVIPNDWKNKKIWLKIGGCHAQGWIWVNGVFLGHDDSFCASYKYDISDLIKPGEKCVVVVKARNDVPSGKGLFSHIVRFGGLYRSVELEATSDLMIDDLWVVGDIDNNKIKLNIQLRNNGQALAQLRDVMAKVVITTIGDGKVVAEKAFALNVPDTNAVCETALDVGIKDLKPWFPDEPNLYRASVQLTVNGKVIDGWEERFGVKKWEVRGGEFYLNNRPHFVRGYGDDYVFPKTLISPPSREEHMRLLKIAKDFGFTYVRHHTHTQIPEFFEAADEVGIMVQPELPYYGNHPSARVESFFRPKEDLRELYHQYRRYVSFATYCTGNEGHMGVPIDEELYQLAKDIDPSRLVLHQDGGLNTPKNSDFMTGPVVPWTPMVPCDYFGGGAVDNRVYTGKDVPFFAHEYMNLAVDEDPRLEELYKHAILPPFSRDDFTHLLKSNGLTWEQGIACIDAGSHLQSYYQKLGLEHARLDPWCDGYIYWTIIDLGSPSAQGLLNQFWGQKASTPKFFKQFNAPTAILLKDVPQRPVFVSGENRKAEWVISHFGLEPIQNETLHWSLKIDGKIVGKGQVDGISAKIGERLHLNTSEISAPEVSKPCKIALSVSLGKTGVSNSWDLWVFPKEKSSDISGEKLSARENLLSKLVKRYPKIVASTSEEGKKRPVLITDCFDKELAVALKEGKSVFLTELNGPISGATLGWWIMQNQRGTVVSQHEAFGDFPHDGYMDAQMFRLIDKTMLLNAKDNQPIEPLMFGHGKAGYLAHVFQAKVLNGKLFASGLNLFTDHPEADALLDNFVRYIQSTDFSPQCVWDISDTLETARLRHEFASEANGFEKMLDCEGKMVYNSFMGDCAHYYVHGTAIGKELRWLTKPVPDDVDTSKPYKIRWASGSGYRSADHIPFGLYFNGKRIMTLSVVGEDTTWTSEDGAATLRYRMFDTDPQALDTSGMAELTVPRSWVTQGEPVELRIVPEGNSSRWFSVYDTTKNTASDSD